MPCKLIASIKLQRTWLILDARPVDHHVSVELLPLFTLLARTWLRY